jgi:tetratricopeptide (TPR) repeat protein
MYPWAGIYELIDGSDLWPDNWALVLHERYSRYNQEIVNKIASKEKRNVFLSSFKALPFNQIHRLMHSADIGLSLYLPQFQSNDISARKNLEYLGMSSGKTTTYLQYGLPILINEVGIISEHTRRNNLGRVVKEISDIPSVLLSLTSRELSQCRENSFSFFEGVLDLNLNIKPLLSKIHSLVNEKKSKELSQFENKLKEINYTRSESINDSSDDLEGRKIWVEPTKPSPEKLYLIVKKFLDEGKKREAIGAFKAFLALYPNYAQAHNDLGLLYCQNGAKDKALSHYQKAVKLAPDIYTFQKNLADFYYVILEQIENSLIHYAKALSYNPADIHTLLMLGHISVSKKKFDEAIDFYNKVLKIEPWNTDAREKLDKLYDIKGMKVRMLTAEDSLAKPVIADPRRIEDRLKELGKGVAESNDF